MSGFIPDLASWALRGGAATADTAVEPSSTDNMSDEPMSPEELRAQRLARLEMMQKKQQEKEKNESIAMEIDEVKPVSQTSTSSPTVKQSPIAVLTARNESESQKLKKLKPEKETLSDIARKLQRRKEALLKKVLNVVLVGTQNSQMLTDSVSSSALPTLIDIGSTDVTTQSVAEIIATRLSMDPPSMSVQQQSLIAYLASSHRRASEELKSMQQQESIAKKSKSPQFVEELTELLEEIKRQLVSYAATCLLEPDLFSWAKDSTVQLAKCLLYGTGGSSDTTENHAITFAVNGSISSSFYHLLIDELSEQDLGTLEETIVPALVDYFMNLLRKCDSILDNGSFEGNSPVAIVSALTALCSHKVVALNVSKVPSFLLPPASSPKAAEVVRPVTSSNTTVNFLQMLTNSNPETRSYLKRSGPALDKDTLLGLCLRIGIPNSRHNLATINPAFSPSNILRQSLSSIEQVTSQQRSQLRVHQTACFQFVMALIKGGLPSRDNVLKWFQDALLVNVGASAIRPDATKLSSPNLLLNMSIMLLKLCEPFVNDEKKQHLIDPGFVSSEADHGGVFATTGDDAVVRLGGDDYSENTTSAQPYKPKNSFIPLCFFYCARSLHLGLAPLLSQHESLLRHISHIHWQITSSNRDLQSEPRFAMMIARQRSDEVALYQGEMIADTLRFCNLSAKVLYSIEDDDILRTMPEDFVSDICDIIISIAKLKGNLLRGLEFRYVFKLIVKLLSAKYASVSSVKILYP